MIPKQAIEKAIEGGWKHPAIEWSTEWKLGGGVVEFKALEPGPKTPNRKRHYIMSVQKVILDPTFWQALGKMLGWDVDPEDKDTVWPVWETHDGKGGSIILLDDWQNAALNFYHLILTGGDTEKFWEEILK